MLDRGAGVIHKDDMRTKKPIDIYFLLGATASGKSSVGLLLAGMMEAEIVSVDSMQVYRGMDIGTAKATAEELGQVRHHLIDVVEPNESFSAARFVELAGKDKDIDVVHLRASSF